MDAPNTQFLNRDGAAEEIMGVLERWATLIEKVVNFGTKFLPVLDKSVTGRHDLSALQLARHSLEMLDGVSALIRQSAIKACEPLLRSQIEATLQVTYMLESRAVERGLAYHVQHLHGRMEWAEKSDPTTLKGKQYAAEMMKDTSMDGMTMPAIDSAPIVASIMKQLATPELAPIEMEWQRIRTAGSKPRRVWWYMLFGGPNSIELLAKEVKKHGWYEVLYRMFSGSSHASNALDGIRSVKGKGLLYQPLRHPQSGPMLGTLSVSVAMHLFTVLTNHYASKSPGGFSKWYVEEIMPEFKALQAISFTETMDGKPV